MILKAGGKEMTIKEEYKVMKLELRNWNKRSNFDGTKWLYRIENTRKTPKQGLQLNTKKISKIYSSMKNMGSDLQTKEQKFCKTLKDLSTTW